MPRQRGAKRKADDGSIVGGSPSNSVQQHAGEAVPSPARASKAAKSTDGPVDAKMDAPASPSSPFSMATQREVRRFPWTGVNTDVWVRLQMFSWKPLEHVVSQQAAIYVCSDEEALTELKRFLYLKVTFADFDAELLAPTPLMDKLWQACILDTRFYHDLMRLACPAFTLHYRPRGVTAIESEKYQLRESVLKAAYKAAFDEDPLLEQLRDVSPPPPPPAAAKVALPPPIQAVAKAEKAVTKPSTSLPGADTVNITVKSQTGEEVFFKIKRHTQLESVMNAYKRRINMERIPMRFLFDGSKIESWQTPGDWDMTDGDIIDVMVVQCGC